MADQVPDFDSMTPEEIMAWMESLAKRQGANEGFTTSAEVAVPEIDPSTVQIDEPGYIPYGMDAETWARKQEEERKRKAERMQSAPPAARPAPAAALPAAPPPTPQPTPAPQPAAPAPAPAAQPAASAQPNFDEMTPEQIMAWMESLARRQGASEGFTSETVMEVAEIDPSTVQIDEPGYIPYGMDADTWARKQEEERQRKAQRQQAAPPAARPTPAAPRAPEPAARPAPPAAPPVMPEPVAAAPSGGDDALSWLESLAAGSQTNDLPQLDLSALSAPLGASAGVGNDDPMAWLESLSQSQTDIPGLEQFSLDSLDAAPAAPQARAVPTEANPLEWLESLARRQGADDEELTTPAGMEIPFPDRPPVQTGPGYTDYTFEAPLGNEEDASPLDFLNAEEEDDLVFETDSDQLEDPSSWLDALASGQEVETSAASAKNVDVVQALAKGQAVPQDDMVSWMSELLEKGASRNDVPDYIDEPDGALVQAELPDWLIEQVGAPPEIKTPKPVEASTPLVETIVEPPDVDMPDWLKEDIEESEHFSFDSIFDTREESAAVPAAPAASPQKLATSEIEIDPNDPWVEAFELERKMGPLDVNNVPEWYVSALTDSGRQPVEQAVMGLEADEGLADANLPLETELPIGQIQAVPDWLGAFAAQAPVAADAVVEMAEAPADMAEAAFMADDMPDWLRESITVEEEPTGEELPDWLRSAGIDEVESVPEWLVETIDSEETPVVEAQAAAPAPAPAAPKPAAQPVPVPTPASVAPAAINVSQALDSARQSYRSGDIDGSLLAYESIVRANTQLETVISDLSSLLKDENLKKNPAVYRVLGDGYMRQGKLQEALETYRKALNLL